MTDPEPDEPDDGSWFDEEREPPHEMPEDPFPAEEPVADGQATQEFSPAWDEAEEPAPLPRRTVTAARTRPLPPRGPTRPQPRSTRRPPPPPRAKPGRPAGAPHGRAGRRVLALLALAFIGGALWLINATFQPFHGEPTGAVSVTVPSGSDAGKIGEILEAAGVIDSARLFEANATVTMRRGKLRPGKYQLPRGMTNGAAIEALMQGPQAKVVKTFKFTLPEGRSRRENIPAVDKAFEGDYGKATTSERYLRRARKLGAPRSARSLEGFLFPATYQMINGASASDLVERQLDAFRQNFARVNMKAARRRNLTRYDVLTIASMVEREAQLPKERPLIAAVMYNRLRQGIPLGIDATIRYQINNWSRPLRVSELERDTPYNTRTRRGLPPTPIGNPGLDSIKAAANPAKVKYLFFVRKPGKSGAHAFSSTNSQFERDVARYQASRGGP
jgi:peptidoglycan lytic transglycosylase G